MGDKESVAGNEKGKVGGKRAGRPSTAERLSKMGEGYQSTGSLTDLRKRKRDEE